MLVLSRQIQLALVTSISKITQLFEFLNIYIALGHFVIIYKRKHVVPTPVYKGKTITRSSTYPQVYLAQVVRKTTISSKHSFISYSQWFKSDAILIFIIIFIFLSSYTVYFIFSCIIFRIL